MSKTPSDKPQRALHLPAIPFLGLWIHLVLLGVVVSFLCIPQIQKLLEQSYTLTESEAQAHIIENATTSNATSQNDNSDALDQTILQTSLLPEDHVVEFVEVFEKAAAETGIKQRVELTSSKRVVQKGVVNIPVQISLSGSWDGIVQFLGKIEQSPLYINMTAMTYSPESLASSEYTVTISAVTFWKQLL